jgi:hypothetical protein
MILISNTLWMALLDHYRSTNDLDDVIEMPQTVIFLI